MIGANPQKPFLVFWGANGQVFRLGENLAVERDNYTENSLTRQWKSRISEFKLAVCEC
jgi:hypothetical protein